MFGDYDSILGDSSFLAKLDNAEQNLMQDDLDCAPTTNRVDQLNPDFTALRSSREDHLTDSILDGFGEDDILTTQLGFQEEVLQNAKRNQLLDGDKTSTPLRIPERTSENKTEKLTANALPKARRSMMDQLKRTMLSNAAAPSSVSRSVVLQEAVVSEEISVAMQAMEMVSTEMMDLGPFFGLPTKVKDLIYNLRGIKDLYGELAFSAIYHFYSIQDSV